MVWSRWNGAVLLLLALAGLAWTHTGLLNRFSSSSVNSQDLVLVDEPNWPGRLCRVVQRWRTREGCQACKVQCLQTGEYLTIVDLEPGESVTAEALPHQGGGLLQAFRKRIYHWGRQTTCPPDFPCPPEGWIVDSGAIGTKACTTGCENTLLPGTIVGGTSDRLVPIPQAGGTMTPSSSLPGMASMPSNSTPKVATIPSTTSPLPSGSPYAPNVTVQSASPQVTATSPGTGKVPLPVVTTTPAVPPKSGTAPGTVALPANTVTNGKPGATVPAPVTSTSAQPSPVQATPGIAQVPPPPFPTTVSGPIGSPTIVGQQGNPVGAPAISPSAKVPNPSTPTGPGLTAPGGTAQTKPTNPSTLAAGTPPPFVPKVVSSSGSPTTVNQEGNSTAPTTRTSVASQAWGPPPRPAKVVNLPVAAAPATPIRPTLPATPAPATKAPATTAPLATAPTQATKPASVASTPTQVGTLPPLGQAASNTTSTASTPPGPGVQPNSAPGLEGLRWPSAHVTVPRSQATTNEGKKAVSPQVDSNRNVPAPLQGDPLAQWNKPAPAVPSRTCKTPAVGSVNPAKTNITSAGTTPPPHQGLPLVQGSTPTPTIAGNNKTVPSSTGQTRPDTMAATGSKASPGTAPVPGSIPASAAQQHPDGMSKTSVSSTPTKPFPPVASQDSQGGGLLRQNIFGTRPTNTTSASAGTINKVSAPANKMTSPSGTSTPSVAQVPAGNLPTGKVNETTGNSPWKAGAGTGAKPGITPSGTPAPAPSAGSPITKPTASVRTLTSSGPATTARLPVPDTTMAPTWRPAGQEQQRVATPAPGQPGMLPDPQSVETKPASRPGVLAELGSQPAISPGSKMSTQPALPRPGVASIDSSYRYPKIQSPQTTAQPSGLGGAGNQVIPPPKESGTDVARLEGPRNNPLADWRRSWGLPEETSSENQGPAKPRPVVEPKTTNVPGSPGASVPFPVENKRVSVPDTSRLTPVPAPAPKPVPVEFPVVPPPSRPASEPPPANSTAKQPVQPATEERRPGSWPGLGKLFSSPLAKDDRSSGSQSVPPPPLPIAEKKTGPEKKGADSRWPGGAENQSSPPLPPPTTRVNISGKDVLADPGSFLSKRAQERLAANDKRAVDSMSGEEQNQESALSKTVVKPGLAVQPPPPPPSGNLPAGSQIVLAANNGLPTAYKMMPVPVVTWPEPTTPPGPPPPALPTPPQPVAFATNAFTPPAPPVNLQQQGTFMPHGLPMQPGMNPYGMQQMMMAPGMPMHPALMPQAAMMQMQQPLPQLPGMPPRIYPGPVPPNLVPQQAAVPMIPLQQAAYYQPGYQPHGWPHMPYANPAMDRPGVAHAGFPVGATSNAHMWQLISALKASLSPSEREWAANGLMNHDWRNNPQVVSALLTAAREDPAGTVRAACVLNLGRMNIPREMWGHTLEHLRGDVDPRVRQAAEQVLLQYGVTPTSSPSVPAPTKS